MNKLTVKDINVKGKKCLVRVDFNVPVKDNVITDENRIQGALPTIKYLMANGAKVILCSHLGRPKGGVDAYQENKKKYSLAVVAKRLNELLNDKVTFADDVIG
ncbi:phosphoglycerate kinase, partial [bacterium]|nr:phosphoglycerate kinase [bacterium]